MKRKIAAFLILIIASFSLYAGVVYYGSGRAVFLENLIQFANFFEIEATGIKNLRLGGEVKAHNVQAANVDKNFIPFGGFETGDEDFTSYVDAAGVLPVDGTGGGPSSFLTCAQSATSPLEGDGSLNMVKFNTASGGQGHGCSYDFTVSAAGQAQGMTLSFDYKWTDVAANEDNDFIVYLYDVDKSELIAPLPYEIKKSQYVTKFISGFMTDATSTNYRLIFHLAQDRAGIFSLKVDNLFVGKSTYARGSPITDWVSYTPTVTVGSGTVPPELPFTGKWRRVGSHMEIKVFAKWTGAPAAAFGQIFARIPTGYDIDYTALAQDQATAVGERNGEFGSYLDVGAFEYQIRSSVISSSRIELRSMRDDGSTSYIGAANITEAIPFAPAAGDYLNASISVPIAGWSSNVVMSETMPGRDIVLVLKGNSVAQTFNHGSITKITNWAVVKNPANIWDATNSRLVIPESGYYSVSAAFYIADTEFDLTQTALRLYKNGSSLITRTSSIEGEIASHLTIAESALYFLKGDILDVRAFQANGDSDNLNETSGATTQNFSLAKLNTGNQTIGLEESVLQKVKAHLPTTTTIGASGSLLRSNGTNSAWDSSIHVAADGKVGIGTSSPASTNGGLDIASGGTSLVLGAVDGTTTRTDSVSKISRIAEAHYLNTEEPATILTSISDATTNRVRLGGGSNLLNAATEITFHTAANTTTLSGTERMRIDSSGNVGIGKYPSYKLDIEGTDVANPVRVVLRNTNAGGSGYYLLGSTGVFSGKFEWDNNNAHVRIGNMTNNSLLFETNGVTRMIITNAGVVNIANLAGSGSRAVNADAAGNLSAASDSRLKQEVPGANIPGLTEILQITPKAYKWSSDIERRGDEAATEIGFFADQVNPIIPSAAPMGSDGYYGLYDRSILAAAVKAIQEQQAIIESLKSRIKSLESRN